MGTIGSVIKVNNVIISIAYGTATEVYEGVCIPIKKGQSISIRSSSNTIATNIKIYGLKFN